MMHLRNAIEKGKIIRVMGIDDAPFDKHHDTEVQFSVMICANTRLEGMLWGSATKDGDDATDKICTLIKSSKFYAQTHVIMIDGVAIGGFNIIRIQKLADDLGLPVMTVMRNAPNMQNIEAALDNFDDKATRLQHIAEAGAIHHHGDFYFQFAAPASKPDIIDINIAAQSLALATDKGKVPEALRLAHLIGSAIKTGQSSRQA